MTQTATASIPAEPKYDFAAEKAAYADAGIKALNAKVDELYEFAGLNGNEDGDEEGEDSFRRSKAVFDVHFNINTDYFWERVNGRTDGSIPITNDNGVNDALVKFYQNSVRDFSSTEFLRGRVLQSKFKAEEVRKTYVGVTEDTCGSCYGNGNVDCHNCNGNGTVRCPMMNCGVSGYVSCGHCSGLGYHTSIHDSRVKANCGRCHGTGQHRCWTCGGATTVRCNGCGGRGQCLCNSCSGYGMYSIYHGGKVILTPTLKLRESDFLLDEQHEIEKWVMEGMPGAVTEPHKTLPYTSLTRQEAYAQNGGDAKNTIMSLSFAVRATIYTVKTKVFNVPVTGRYMKLKNPWIRLTNFMDSLMTKPRQTSSEMRSKTPKEYLEAMKQYPGLHSALTFAWGKGGTGRQEFLAYVDMTAHGGLTSAGVGSIASDLQGTIDDFSKSVYRDTASRPILTLVLLWCLLQSLGYPGSLVADDNIFGLAAYTFLPAWASLLVTRSIARKKMKQQTGNKNLASVKKEAYLIPLCGAALFGLTAFAGIDIWPSDYSLWPWLEFIDRELRITG